MVVAASRAGNEGDLPLDFVLSEVQFADGIRVLGQFSGRELVSLAVQLVDLDHFRGRQLIAIAIIERTDGCPAITVTNPLRVNALGLRVPAQWFVATAHTQFCEVLFKGGHGTVVVGQRIGDTLEVTIRFRGQQTFAHTVVAAGHQQARVQGQNFLPFSQFLGG